MRVHIRTLTKWLSKCSFRILGLVFGFWVWKSCSIKFRNSVAFIAVPTDISRILAGVINVLWAYSLCVNCLVVAFPASRKMLPIESSTFSFGFYLLPTSPILGIKLRVSWLLGKEHQLCPQSLCFPDRIMLRASGWPWTHCVAQAHLKLPSFLPGVRGRHNHTCLLLFQG